MIRLSRLYRKSSVILSSFSSTSTTAFSHPLFPVEITIASQRKVWEEIGFHVDRDNSIFLNEITLHIEEVEGNGNVLGWSFNDNEKALSLCSKGHDTSRMIAGIPLLEKKERKNDCQNSSHRNGVYEIDHIVLRSRNGDSTRASFAALGMEMKKEMSNDAKTSRQNLYRPSKTIIEVISPMTQEKSPSAPLSNIIWGLTFSCSDIEKIHSMLPATTKPPYNAVQVGRKMTVLDTLKHGIPLRIAFMSPHVKASK